MEIASLQQALEESRKKARTALDTSQQLVTIQKQQESLTTDLRQRLGSVEKTNTELTAQLAYVRQQGQGGGQSQQGQQQQAQLPPHGQPMQERRAMQQMKQRMQLESLHERWGPSDDSGKQRTQDVEHHSQHASQQGTPLQQHGSDSRQQQKEALDMLRQRWKAAHDIGKKQPQDQKNRQVPKAASKVIGKSSSPSANQAYPPAQSQSGEAKTPSAAAAVGPEASKLQQVDEDTDQDLESSTSLMICNIPCRVTQRQLVATVEALGFKDKYDYLYIPRAHGGSSSSIGYGFINMLDEKDVLEFIAAITGYRFEGTYSLKRCEVRRARIQGLMQNAEQFPTSRQKRSRWNAPHLPTGHPKAKGNAPAGEAEDAGNIAPDVDIAVCASEASVADEIQAQVTEVAA